MMDLYWFEFHHQFNIFITARTQNAFGRYFRIQIEMALERHGGYSMYVGRKGLDNLYVCRSGRLILKNTVV
jgi:hypothetical protein